MRRCLPLLALFVLAAPLQAHGLLIPEDRKVPPLAMLNHNVKITIVDQVATTRVEQTFRNHTSRALEATYVFPVPKGASVRKFSMWVDGKEVTGEMLDAKKARQIYTDIVRRTQDPGLLEYIDHNLFRMKVFPIAANSDQKVALSYTSVAPRDGNLVEYVYPLKTNGKATRTLEKFSINVTIKSQHAIQNVYSPTHAIGINRVSDNQIDVDFEREQALLDKNFQLFYSISDKDVGLTAITHRPISSEDGYFMLLISPRFEIPEDKVVPRDLVLVLDTSGSMRGTKISQAKEALKYCLKHLHSKDRFALINFATTVNSYRDELVPATSEHLEAGRKWIDDLNATGGTAIESALETALKFRTSDKGRTFTIVFFTDGIPTIGETNGDKIVGRVMKANTENTRIFTFGVGDNVNAAMLDQLAEKTRALSTYVRPAEDLEAKVSSLYDKISQPVLTNLRLTSTGDIRFSEMFPTRLPDLFHNGQLVVLGRYKGNGHTAIKLQGMVGDESKEFVYEIDCPAKTNDERNFVEHVWARRKVGYLLDQIRINGEQKELVDETKALAKKYGIATPYTSYLIVPDGPMPVVRQPNPPAVPPAMGLGGAPNVEHFAKGAARRSLEATRGALQDLPLGEGKGKDVVEELKERKIAFDAAADALRRNDRNGVQSGKVGVALAVATKQLREQTRLVRTAQKIVLGRTLLEIGGIWVDQGFDPKMKTVVVKAQSDAYFALLASKPELKDLFQLGNYLVWVTPSGTALIVDATSGTEKLADADIDALFKVKK
ncbi:MAG: hypothetical protein KatS3mg105_1064 [Gemmatales bacterium]|nr:MAG: hypothetical protein KatS3mg105_1064 [Gemmatales bacterium]